MSKALVDLSTLDLSRDVMSQEELRSLLPHRYEFQLIDGICHVDQEAGLVVGYKDWGEDAWWARGHIPGRPLMPGVLMVESCAQVSTVLMKKSMETTGFIGLGGLEGVRFRGTVVPPTRIHLVSRVGKHSSRMARYPAQCFCAGKLVMEMELLGVLL